MNLALSDEQELLREAARGACSRVEDGRGRARRARGRRAARPVAARRRGRLAGPAGLRGARRRRPGRLRRDARGRRSAAACWPACRCSGCCRRRRCSTPPAHEALEAVAAGEARAAWLPARPPGDVVERLDGRRRARARPRAGAARAVDGDAVSSRATVAWVPDAPAPTCSSSSAPTSDGAPVAGAVEAARTRRSSGGALRRDPRARPRARSTARAARGSTSPRTQLARAWYLAQALLAAESVGAVETALEMAVAYAKERFTFGRAIGSYQAIKHGLTEVLRRLENARSLLYYAGWALRRPARGVRAGGQRGALGRRARRSTSPRARTSPRTAGSARRGSTTRRCSSAARSCRGACSAGAGDATDRVAAELLAAA